jgi:hypothetical protein
MNTAEFDDLQKKGDELNRLARIRLKTVEVLDADYNLAGKFWREDKANRQFWSRVVFRGLCANIEARLYVFRSTALDYARFTNVAFTTEEIENFD